MKNFLRFLRNAANILLIFLFVNLLLLAIPLSSLSTTVTDENNVKSWLQESNFYENLYDNFVYILEIELDGEVKPIAEHIEDSGVFTADEFIGVLKSSIPPEFLQQQAEGVVDGVYAFLDDRNEQLQFTFSLSERSDEFARELGEFFKEGIAALPVCSPQQLLELQGTEEEDFNPLTADCRPPSNVGDEEVDRLVDQLVAQLAGGDGPINSTLTADDVDIDAETRENMKNVYLMSKNFALAALAVSLLLLGLILATSRPWYKGLKIAGLGTVVVGVLMLGSFIFANTLKDDISFSDDSDEFSSSQREAIDNLVSPLARESIGDITTAGTIFSLIAIAAGSAMVITDHRLAKKHQEPKPKTMLDDDYEEGSKDKPEDEDGSDSDTEEQSAENSKKKQDGDGDGKAKTEDESNNKQSKTKSGNSGKKSGSDKKTGS